MQYLIEHQGVTTDLIALKDEIKENFTTLQSRIYDINDGSTKELQCNFGSSASIPCHFNPSNCLLIEKHICDKFQSIEATLEGILDILPTLENGALVQMPASPLTSSRSFRMPYESLLESLGSVVDTVCTSLEQQDSEHTDVGMVHNSPIQDRSQVISHLVNGHNVRHIVLPVVLLVLSMILYYAFIVVEVDEEIT